MAGTLNSWYIGGGPVEVLRRCFADVLNQASVLARVCRQSYCNKTTNIAKQRAQKFNTDGLQTYLTRVL